MTGIPEDARRLTFNTIDVLWNAGAPLTLPMPGAPPCHLLLDPKNRTISLVTAYQDPEPDVGKLRNVRFEAISDGEDDLAVVSVHVEDSVHGAYGLLSTIAEALQVSRAPLAAAVALGLLRHKDVVATRQALTTEKEIGLFGELLVVEHLYRAIGPGPAIASWQGPLAEEHDFVFSTCHLEVKTTAAERRRHVVHGLSQLAPPRHIPLDLLSIQITRSSPADGRTLPQLVAQSRTAAGGHTVALDERLQALGWSADDADLYPTPWTLRTRPRTYHVENAFPAITSSIIAATVPNYALISDITYRIDLTDLNYDAPADPVSGFAEPKAS